MNPTTPDGRYFVVNGRLWRCSNPADKIDQSDVHVDESASPSHARPAGMEIPQVGQSTPLLAICITSSPHVGQTSPAISHGDPRMNSSPITGSHFSQQRGSR